MNLLTGCVLLGLVGNTMGDELTDLQNQIEYRKKKIANQKEENEELRNEIAELDTKLEDTKEVRESMDALGAGRSQGYERILELERDLEGKMAVLLALKRGFLEKLPFKEGEELGDFTDTKNRNYKDAVVGEVSPQGIVINHSAGISRLYANDFPDDFRDDLIKRPESKISNDLVNEVFDERPSKVLKSAAFADRRKELAKRRAERLAQGSKSSSGDLVLQQKKSNMDFHKKREEKALAMIREADTIKRENFQIDMKIERLSDRLKAVKAEYDYNEANFKKVTGGYQSVGELNSQARVREGQNRKDFIDEYYSDRASLEEQMSKLQREILDLRREKRREIILDPKLVASLTDPTDSEGLAAKRKQLQEMEFKLREAFNRLYDMEDHKTKEAREFQRMKVKSDRKGYEQKMAGYQAAIDKQRDLIEAMKKKIDEFENEAFE